MKLFPEFDEVFTDADDAQRAIFFPLATIDLQERNKGVGKVHFVSVHGAGFYGEPFYPDDELFSWDKIRFSWDGERYTFRGDLSALEDYAHIKEWHAEAMAEFEANRGEYLRKNTWQEAQNLAFAKENKRRKAVGFNYYFYVSRVINYLVTKEMFKKTGKFIQGSAYLDGASDHERRPITSLSKTGLTTRSNELIGKLVGYDYIRGGEDEIVLYIDRKKGEVFEKFSWS